MRVQHATQLLPLSRGDQLTAVSLRAANPTTEEELDQHLC